MKRTSAGKGVRIFAALVGPVAILALFLFLSVSFLSGQEEERVYRVGPVHVTVDVRPDGGYRITEEIRWDFRQGTFRYVYRAIDPFERDSMSLVEARSPQTGLTLEEDDWHDGERELRWTFPSREEPLEVILDYRIWGALEELGDRNRVRWEALGRDWDAPREDVILELRLPGSFLAHADSAEIEPADGDITGSPAEGWTIRWSREELAGSDDLEVEVAFPRVVEGAPVGLYDPAAQAFFGGLILFLATLVGGAVVHDRWQGPKVPEGRGSGSAELSILETAVLLHGPGSEAERGFPSLLLTLAHEGRIRFVLEKDRDSFGKPERVRVEPETTEGKESDEPGGEVAEEVARRLLDEVARWPHLQEFAKEAKKLRKEWLEEVRDRLLERGFLEDRSDRAARTRIAATLVLLLSVAVVPAALAVGPRLFGLLGATLGGGIGLFIASTASHPRTKEGARQRRAVLDELGRIRDEVKRAAESDPSRAGDRWVDELPRVVLDPESWAGTVSKIEKGLKKNELATFQAPTWVSDRREKRKKGPEAYRAFHATREVVGLVTGSAAPASQAAATAGVAAGAAAGAAGAAGGGGGGGAG